MKINEGMRAKEFEVEDVFGQSINLKNYAGKTLLLSFFRNGACALCNLRVHQLIQRYPNYQAKGLEMLAVFESPRESILQYVGKQDAPFPIIGDPEGQLYRLYGVETSEAKAMQSINLPQVQAAVQEAAAHGFHLTKEEGSNFYRIPAEFLIGPNLTIQRAYYADYVGDHLSFEEIERLLGKGVNGR